MGNVTQYCEILLSTVLKRDSLTCWLSCFFCFNKSHCTQSNSGAIIQLQVKCTHKYILNWHTIIQSSLTKDRISVVLPHFTLFSALAERFPLVKAPGSKRRSSLWLAWRAEPLPFHPLRGVLPHVRLAAAACAQRSSRHDEAPCRWCRRAAGVLSCPRYNAPGSGSGWDSSAPWSGPPVAACNSASECCPSLTASAWNTVMKHQGFLILSTWQNY